MSEVRLNAYHIMWLFVFFDLPVVTKKERKIYERWFRNVAILGLYQTLCII